MSAADTIRERACMYEWERYEGAPREDIYLRGEQRIYVEYGKDGRLNNARLAVSRSLRVGSETTVDFATDRVKVISWLAA